MSNYQKKDFHSKNAIKNYVLGILISAIFLIGQSLLAQVGVGTTTPDASSVLDITSTEAGMLIPRMTQTNRNNITLPATGLLIYQTDNNTGFYFYNGSTWLAIATGNADDGDWTVNTGNVERNSGNVLINTTDQNYKLSVAGITSGGTESTINIGPNSINDHAVEINRGYSTYGFGLKVNQNNSNIFNNKAAISAFNTLGAFTTNLAYSTNPFASYGVYTRTISPSVNAHGGYFEVSSNTITGGGIQYGLRSVSNSNGDSGEIYGIKSEVSGSGSSDKYGFYTDIPISSGGQQYGVFSDVRNSSGYAGYFIGRTSFGNTNANRYTMPETDGASGEVLTAAGDGTTSWAAQSGGGTKSIVSATLSANQVPITFLSKITFDTTSLDTNSEFDTTDNRFIVSNNGYYRVSASISATTNDIIIGLSIYVNGVEEKQKEDYDISSTNPNQLDISGLFQLNINDFVEIFIEIVPTNTTISSNTASTYFEIEQID